MTIKELEIATGMTRANIRFYESEGLITPERKSNGYREYSEEDVQVLEKIKLLRSLQISLEEIKMLHNGSKQLNETLEKHLVQLEQNKKKIETSHEVCKTMKEEGARYQTLNVKRYMALYESQGGDTGNEIRQDKMPHDRWEFRRFFARMLDFYFYDTLFLIFVTLVLNHKFSFWSTQLRIPGSIISIILMLILEPLFLSVFGTTLGKGILGLRVFDNFGKKLTYSEAAKRTRSVLWNGMFWLIPFFCLWRLYKSYEICKGDRTLEWEYDSEICLKDQKWWREIAWCGGYLTIFLTLLISIGFVKMPRNRGDITVDEFKENYKQLNEYHFDGNAEVFWEETQEEELTNVVIQTPYPLETPTVNFIEQDGVMTGMTIELEVIGEDGEITLLNDYQNEMILALIAFMGAQKDCNILFNRVYYYADMMAEKTPFTDYDFEKYGVSVQYTAETEGYQNLDFGDVDYPKLEEDFKVKFQFVMQKKIEKS